MLIHDFENMKAHVGSRASLLFSYALLLHRLRLGSQATLAGAAAFKAERGARRRMSNPLKSLQRVSMT